MPSRRTPTAKRQTTDKPLLLGKHHEVILEAIHFYRYMTALDVAYRLYSPKSLTHVRELLAVLSGGADFQPNQYLYRFPLPQRSRGRTELVYTLGSRGREFLTEEKGRAVDWYFRPQKVKYLSLGRVLHQLTLTRFLVAAHVWCAAQPAYRLTQTRISYELAHTPARVSLASGRKTETLTVVPDAWLLFEELQEGAHASWLPVLLEIDRGTEYQQKFKQHVRARVELIRSGAYREQFGQTAVTVAYATTGEIAAYRETRRAAMSTWTQEVLAEQGRERWASIFRFCSFSRETLFGAPLFEAPLWYRPDQPEPVSLFAA